MSRDMLTDAQVARLRQLLDARADSNVHIIRRPYGLPEGYIEVVFVGHNDFTVGIAPNGDSSS